MASDPRTAVTEPFEAYVVRNEDGVSAGVEVLSGLARPPRRRCRDRRLLVVGQLQRRTGHRGRQPGGADIATGTGCRPGRLGRRLQLAVALLAAGDEVLAHGHDIGVARHGGFAGFASVPADWALPIPEGLTMRRAMAVGTAGFTAALSIDELERHGLTPSSGPVVVTGTCRRCGVHGRGLAVAPLGYEVEASTGR